MRQFLLCLLNAAEKAAEIARVCRKEKELFKLLIQVISFNIILIFIML